MSAKFTGLLPAQQISQTIFELLGSLPGAPNNGSVSNFLVYTYIDPLNFQFLHISWKICLF
jgi:hypothetical protein